MSNDQEPSVPAGATPTILEAIVTKRCVTATYNRETVLLAPHALFVKNDAQHVGAATIERGGRIPREARIGVFKLDGLGGVAISDRPFETSPVWDARDERFESALIAVED